MKRFKAVKNGRNDGDAVRDAQPGAMGVREDGGFAATKNVAERRRDKIEMKAGLGTQWSGRTSRAPQDERNWHLSRGEVAFGMRDEPDPPPVKHTLGKRQFERVNKPTEEPDPNAVRNILGENLARDHSLDLPEIERELAAHRRAKWMKHVKVLVFLAVVNGLCFGLAKAANWNPYVMVPALGAAGMITAATLFVVYVVF